MLQADAWNAALKGVPGLPRGEWSPYFSGLDRADSVDLFRRTIVGDEDPAEVVLLDLEPDAQKTAIDFAATKSAPRRRQRRPARSREGGAPPVSHGRAAAARRCKRIYNRIVFDELIQTGVALPFDFREDLDVRWVPHPNWYWTWSKASLPFLAHETVPKATVLSAFGPVPEDVGERYVLKPLFSFAGGGVNVDPTPADVARIPEAERAHWVLMEKIAYDPCLRAVDGGGVKVEVRMMFFRPDGAAEPTLALNLCRLSRGKMLGVDFNKDFTWVGSSVALKPA